ncbi:MAG TPA: hypothetical protein VHM19_11235 [Polyangiales bacterium]|jgi:hypothetical protein|nr:hypothetical protein [Polyangiales bacterium]
MTKRSKLLLCAATLLASGCYTTTIRSGLPEVPKPSVEYDERWHHGAVLGIAEISGPYDLTKICPRGWARISTKTSFVNGFVDLITGGLYNPQTVTVVCAAVPEQQSLLPAEAVFEPPTPAL